MRNPIRLKNLNLRFLPLYVGGLLVLVLHPPQPIGFAAALPLIGAGLWIRGWGAGHLVKNHDLTVTGPYAHLRHPLYAGTLLIGTGFALLLGGWISLGIVAALWPWFTLHYFPRKERSESERLELLYGEAFLRYRDAVPALWPRLSGWQDAASSRAQAPGEAAGGWSLDRYSENNELGTLLAVLAGVLVFGLRAGLVAQ
jgi:protein-S-isoprenylcysteine O-methyltransferase Ste14